ncbi:MAG TPA: efflux RND transporter permease subunit [bacterium]
MKLPQLSVERPVFVSMIFLGVLSLGLMSLKFLPIDLMPDITLPSAGIVTIYPGATPQDVEMLVTKPIEDYVSTVPKLKEVTSRSLENISVVSLKFAWGTDMDEASNEIRSRIDMAKGVLPDDIENPVIFKFDMSMWPILFYGVEADENYPKLHDLLDEKVINPLKRIPGVAIISVFGGLYREIHVNLDKARIERFGLSVQQVIQAIQSANISLPAGNLKTGKKEFTIRMPAEFKRVKELKNVVIGYKQGGRLPFKTVPVYLRDIATVEDSFKETESIVRINGKPGVLLMIQKQSGINTLDVAKKVKEKIAELEMSLPQDIHFYLSQDASEFIQQSINNLTDALLYGGLLVLLVVFIFLRQLAGSIIIGITIPFSLIISFIFMYLFNYTINIMSLTALAIAVGMVVDDAIVIYENIFRHKDHGIGSREASLYGASEVGLAVSASTLTIVAVFFPMIFVPGIAGIMFKQIGFVVCVVILASLFASLTLTPMMASKMLKSKTNNNESSGIFYYLYDASEKLFISIEELYKHLLEWIISHKKITILTGVIIFTISIQITPFLGTEFFPETDQGQLNGNVELSIGTRVEETAKTMAILENIMSKNVPEAKIFFTRAGRTETGWATLIGRREDSNIIMFGATLVKKKDRTRSNKEIGFFLNREMSSVPGVKIADFYTADPMQSAALGGAKPLSYEIYGDDLDKTYRVALEIKNILKTNLYVTDITISMEEGKPELDIFIDKENATLLGIAPAQVVDTIRTYFAGRTASKFREGGREYDIVVKLRGEDRQMRRDIENAPIITPLGSAIQLKNIAGIEDRIGSIEIDRKNQGRMVKVEAGIYGKSLGEVQKEVDKAIKKLIISEDINVAISGALKEQKESFSILSIVFLLSIFLVYIVMAAQFESLIDPFIIMFSVPFAATGVIWGLLLTGKPFSLFTFVGLITLIGIVVKNAIVLVDYMNILRERGIELTEAIKTAGATRLRPVMMTSFTTIFGMVPLVVSNAEGSEMWSMLGLTIISGLFISTLVTLFFVPAMYAIFKKARI